MSETPLGQCMLSGLGYEDSDIMVLSIPDVEGDDEDETEEYETKIIKATRGIATAVATTNTSTLRDIIEHDLFNGEEKKNYPRGSLLQLLNKIDIHDLGVSSADDLLKWNKENGVVFMGTLDVYATMYPNLVAILRDHSILSDYKSSSSLHDPFAVLTTSLEGCGKFDKLVPLNTPVNLPVYGHSLFWVTPTLYSLFSGWWKQCSYPDDFGARLVKFVDSYQPGFYMDHQDETPYKMLKEFDYGPVVQASKFGCVDDLILTADNWTHTAHVIKSGVIKGPELAKAVLLDCHAWIVCRPDIWPVHSEKLQNAYSDLTTTTTTTSTPPSQLDLLTNLPSVAFSATLKSLDDTTLVTTIPHLSKSISQEHLPTIKNELRSRIRSPKGSLHWMLPCTQEESTNALAALKTWLPSHLQESSSGSSAEEVLMHEEFPLLPYVRYCLVGTCLSMRARRHFFEVFRRFAKSILA